MNNIKPEHEQLFQSVADHALENQWTTDAMIHFVTDVVLMQEYPDRLSKEGRDRLLLCFESPVKAINLAVIIETHYNLTIACQALVERMQGDMLSGMEI